MTRCSPRVLGLRISGVDLYNDGEPVILETEESISAFVGANGIGKSTLLALTNFGVTGLVVSPSAAFKSVDEFAELTSGFATAYFGGRVLEQARETAEVEVTYQIGPWLVVVARGLFDGRLVRTFRASAQNEPDVSAIQEDSQSEVTLAYQELVTRAAGLATFDQFCFWQLFVLTFDEKRHLLFWDDKTLQATLMISLGRSPDEAVTAENLRRGMERLDSLARNARWRATQASNRRARLLRQRGADADLSDEELVALHARHEELEGSRTRRSAELLELETSLHDSTRRIAELSIDSAEVEASYLAAFSSRSIRRSPNEHPVLIGLRRDRHCDLCGSESVEIGTTAEAQLASGHCLLCESDFETAASTDYDIDGLVQLDARLSALREDLEGERSKYSRLRGEVQEAAGLLEAAASELRDFLGANESALAERDTSKIDAQVVQLDGEIASGIADAETYRRERDELRETLEPIVDSLADAYETIEKAFVPTFRRLAGDFIGRSVDVEFERSAIDVGLRFSLDGQSRRLATELSESQQFFLDIALRMSLVHTFIDGDCTFLVDTPEGSLDIAYETRAGELFAKYSADGKSILMTSNLNASSLMLALARAAGGSRMRVHRMTEWARLSEVQLDSLPLFEHAYAEIDAALADAQ